MPASSKRALIGALVANIAIAITKFVVGAITGSTVMVTEGIHSLVDTGNSGLMLFGQARSRRPADAAHPFGYGMELYFWAFVVAMVVFGGGGGLSIYNGIMALIHPKATTSLWPNYIVIVAAAVFETASLVVGLREFGLYRRERRFAGSMLEVIRASKNPAIFLTVLEDSAALVGLVIAAAGITLGHVLGSPAIDGIASILIGLVLVIEAVLLGFECRGLIIGESARPIVIDAIHRVAERHADLGVIAQLRTLQLGADAILVVIEMRFADHGAVDNRARAIERFTADLRATLPSIRHVAFELV
jgi:cation diffusion facilitator family transporter